jgi:hypothetical protein
MYKSEVMIMKSKLVNKFSNSSLNHVQEVLNDIQLAAISLDVRETNVALLDTVDHLCRVANMLADVIKEEKAKGYVENANPEGYINGKLAIAQSSFDEYLKTLKVK